MIESNSRKLVRSWEMGKNWQKIGRKLVDEEELVDVGKREKNVRNW